MFGLVWPGPLLLELTDAQLVEAGGHLHIFGHLDAFLQYLMSWLGELLKAS